MKRITMGAATAVAALVSALVVPGTAYAAGPAIEDVGSSLKDWSVIDVRLNHSGPITDVTAHVRPQGSDTEVATVKGFTESDRVGPDEGVWSSAPVRLKELGDYAIDVEVTDASGATTTKKDAGTLHYAKQPVFSSFRVTPTAPTLEDRTVTATGDLVVRDPVTRDTTALPDAPVEVSLDRNGEATATTDAAGHFSVSHELEQGGWASATYRGGLGYAHADWIAVTPKAAPTRIVLDKSSHRVDLGQQVDVSGLLQYRSGTAWKPLPGVKLALDRKNCTACDPVEATSDPSGRFTFTKYATERATWQVGFPAGRNPWIDRTTTAAVTVDVVARTAFEDFSASLDKNVGLEIAGRLRITGRDEPSGRVPVRIQYSPDGRTGWTTRRTTDVSFGSRFTEQLPGHTDGHWRLQYAGTADIKGTTSTAVHASRTLTRIKGAGASPEPVRKGRTLTVRGTLQERKPGWKGYGAQKVQILFRPKGLQEWSLMGTTTTKSDGSFSKGFTARRDGTWAPVFLDADSGHFVAGGHEDYVDVK
ncbi:hypothetical protein ABT112_28180 [Streptomyces sp. NPDC002055]|uniref:hypothetical protein n=1 Tax=Streptomyces sp. NPDC002055 TaxID=3154534 RepID=UPI0033254520